MVRNVIKKGMNEERERKEEGSVEVEDEEWRKEWRAGEGRGETNTTSYRKLRK